MIKKIIGFIFAIDSVLFIVSSIYPNLLGTGNASSERLVMLFGGIVSAFIGYKLLSKPKEKNDTPSKIKKESKKEIRLKNDIAEINSFISSEEKIFKIPDKMNRLELIKIFEDKTDKTISSSLGGLFLNNSFISVDDTRNLFYIGNNMYVYKYDFSKLTDFEYFENGNVIVSGKSLATVAGGLMFGLRGAIVGASGKRKQINEINNVSLKIYLNDLNKPQIQLTLLSQKTKTESSAYQLASSKADEMLGILNYIKHKEI